MYPIASIFFQIPRSADNVCSFVHSCIVHSLAFVVQVPRSADEVRAIFDFLAPKLRLAPSALETMAADPDSTLIDVTGKMENPFLSKGDQTPASRT